MDTHTEGVTVVPQLKAPIFLLGCHKSGTSLLRSLLDGHPHLNVFPRETHPFEFLGEWVEYSLRYSYPEERERGSLFEAGLKYVHEQNNTADRHSDLPQFKGYDVDVFSRSFEEYDWNSLSPRERISAYLCCLNRALGNRPPLSERRVVEKSVEHAEFALELKQLFPDARFVHIVRNPYATLVAIRKMKTTKGCYPYLGPIASSLRSSSYYLFKNRKSIQDFMVVRFEDLVNDTQETMGQIAQFLQIGFSDCLLVPTYEGEVWSGNSTASGSFSGVSKAPVDSYLKSMNHIEAFLAERAAAPVFDVFNYARLGEGRGGYFHRFVRKLPFRGESLQTYLRNRLFARTVSSMWSRK